MKTRYEALAEKWKKINLAFPAFFWSRVSVKQIGDCWEWNGQIGGNGYGQVRKENKVWMAHRMAFFMTFGKISEDMYICHHCDNKKCVNPFHLFEGTPKDNMDDMVQKGRRVSCSGEKNGMFGMRGSASPCAVLTEENVLEIRRQYATGAFTQLSIARKLGVTQGLISAVIRRAIWTHI